ncbi:MULTISPECIES: putative quinol monooxygenase [Dactylosporangium]|uniref:Antibiotic biosynthesis monooxygenase n=2 Tax=Dactylosporangium TaxID=35753 RepID=A0A9W6KTM0_9ACTN|nr:MULTISPECIES: antibiotic biosynthesis monooxygenase family protein [Dactylosporangium]UAB93077.1 antibiotic biosynthesis monooxygenase [Dactylosporangium vinaceum]UWZ41490.1 antibiotic biosynthesis monooxygenase [Dactylosporangium matsuzakiense]GLL07053.1 antibiotic biosynthesis monooxygenase [Dactylosporangium matsuzakiense]
MIIIAGALRVDAADRDRYLAAVVDVARLARDAPGCLDFIQSPDPLDAERIQVYERWESDEDLLAFRSSGGPDLDLPPLVSADVRKYRIAGVEAP